MTMTHQSKKKIMKMDPQLASWSFTFLKQTYEAEEE